jgi:hypothetical protein
MFSNVISSGITLAKVLSGLSKTINIAKEVIPLYESVKPMIGSAKNLPKILNSLNRGSKVSESTKEVNSSTIKTTIESSLINNPTFFK